MYRNNYRPPQMGQLRPNMSFGNRGSGMTRPCQNQGNNCNSSAQIMPLPANDCCAPVPDSHCCATQPINDCCAPQPNDCCEPCCASDSKNDCCTPVLGNNCCEPCCESVSANDCCAPQPDHNCCCNNEKKDAGCFPSKKDPVAGMALAMAYVPWQDYKDICSEEEAWCKGTIFAQLDLDFVARRCN